MKGPLAVVTSLFTSMALVAASQPLPPQTPVPCAPRWQDSTLVRETSAQAVVGARQFTIDMRSAYDRTAGSQLDLSVRRGAALAMDFTLRTTAKGELEVHMLLGEGFHGPKELAFASADRKTLTGTIDGRPIAPFDLAASPETMKLADGGPLPEGDVDEDVEQALPKLLEAVKAQCSAAAPSPEKTSALSLVSEPAHPSHPDSSAGCILCVLAAQGVLAACLVGAVLSAAACGPFYPLCFAVLALGCAAALFATLCSGCSFFVGLCSAGGSCCPVFCGPDKQCCGNGESCAGTEWLCCSPGLRACGTSNCCAPTDGCLANGTCCPIGNTICKGVCCPTGVTQCLPSTGECCLGSACGNACCNPSQTCTNSATSTCCDTEHACGAVCCDKSQSCTDPNRGVCTSCSNCSGPNRECCYGQCCTEPAFCSPFTRRCEIIG